MWIKCSVPSTLKTKKTPKIWKVTANACLVYPYACESAVEKNQSSIFLIKPLDRFGEFFKGFPL